MNKYAVYHIVDTPYSYGKDMNTLMVRIRVAKNDIKTCNIYFKDRYDYTCPYQVKEMTIVGETDLFSFYETELSINWNRYRYFFELIDFNNNVAIFNERGFVDGEYDNNDQSSAKAGTLLTNAFQFPYIAEEDLYTECKWLQEAIVYQIFPDRFCNGNPATDPEHVQEWGKGYIGYYSKFGGDLQGIINKLDYIESLGVNLIYLTPIFKSSSNHKYNTADYFTIDPQFGTNELAKELIDKCHKRGIKIIFDAVFNHSGDDFFAFKDVLNNQENSKYKDWYFIKNYPVSTVKINNKLNYYTFGDCHRNMPKLNTNNKEVREYLLNVGQYWVKEYGIDGWRLDVCDEVGHDFWKDFRKVIKSANKDAIIIGEIMHESNTFLKGDQLDGIMNYPIKHGIMDFFGKRTINGNEFLSIMATNRMLYMSSITKQMWNLIDSHDTPRFLTECDNDINRLKLAVAFQFTYIGVPYIYYGDEIGLTGGADPQNRKCMVWDEEKQNKDLLEFHKKIINIRKENIGLVHGDFSELYSHNNAIAYSRNYGHNKYIIVLNNNDIAKSISLSVQGNYLNLFTDEVENMNNTITLNPMEFKILRYLN